MIRKRPIGEIKVGVAHRRAQYDESCRLCSGGSGCTFLRVAAHLEDLKILETVQQGLRGCMKRLLTLWRMSAVRVRLPPAFFLDVDNIRCQSKAKHSA